MYLDRAKQLIQELGYILPEHIRPCNEAQVVAMARKLGVTLPLAYQEFLLWAGLRLGDVMVGSEFYFSALMLYDYKEFSRNLLELNHLDPSPLDEHAIIIYSHQGYQFAYIRDDEGDNPPVYGYDEGQGGIERRHKCYSDMIENLIVDSAKYAALYLNDLYNHTQPASLIRRVSLQQRFTQLPEKLFEFVNLEHLDVRYSRFESLSPKIATFSKLKRLELQGNHLSELPREVGELKNLEILYVANNRLTTIIHIIREIPNLQVCYLEGNPIPAAEIEQIQHEFPHLKLRP
jgi:hypothetical protein